MWSFLRPVSVVLEPYIDYEIYVVGSDDFSVCTFMSW